MDAVLAARIAWGSMLRRLISAIGIPIIGSCTDIWPNLLEIGWENQEIYYAEYFQNVKRRIDRGVAAARIPEQEPDDRRYPLRLR
jgi:hypothetical protein